MVKPEPHAPDEGGTVPRAEREAADLKVRLDALKADLCETAAGRPGGQGARGRAASDGGAIGAGLRAGSELIAGVIVGGGIGYLLDRQTGFSPLFLIIFLMFGMAAGFWNVYRLARRTGGAGR